MAPGPLEPARWRALVARLAPRLDAAATFDELEGLLAEPHRAYHTAAHVAACLAHLDGVRDLCERPDEVEFALWLHDAIYRTRGGDSEAESAALAARWLTEGGAQSAAAERVCALILATRHDATELAGDAALLVDIDLAILGAPPDDFDRYEDEVRREYRWVPGPVFRAKRAALLRGFLDRETIYTTEVFRERLEAEARANLARSIERLT